MCTVFRLVSFTAAYRCMFLAIDASVLSLVSSLVYMETTGYKVIKDHWSPRSLSAASMFSKLLLYIIL